MIEDTLESETNILDNYDIHFNTALGDPPIETMVVRAGSMDVEVVRIHWPLLIFNFKPWVRNLALDLQIAGERAGIDDKDGIEQVYSAVGTDLVKYLALGHVEGLREFPEIEMRAKTKPWQVGKAEFSDYLGSILMESTPTELALADLCEVQCLIREDQSTIYVTKPLTAIVDYAGSFIVAKVVTDAAMRELVRESMVKAWARRM